MKSPDPSDRFRPWTAVIAFGILIAVVALYYVSLWRFNRSRFYPEHQFVLNEHPAFLTEKLALEMAIAAMAQDGLDTSVWQPEEDRRTTAPDGTLDTYLVRHPDRPNDATIGFRQMRSFAAGRVEQISVSIRLDKDRITCQGFRRP